MNNPDSNNHDDNVRDLTEARAASTYAQAVREGDEAKLDKWMAQVDPEEDTLEMGERTDAIYSDTDPERNPYLNDSKNAIKDVKRIAAAGALAVAGILGAQFYGTQPSKVPTSISASPVAGEVQNKPLEKFDITKYKKYQIIPVSNLDEAIKFGYLIETSDGIFPATGLDWHEQDESKIELGKPETLSLIVASKG